MIYNADTRRMILLKAMQDVVLNHIKGVVEKGRFSLISTYYMPDNDKIFMTALRIMTPGVRYRLCWRGADWNDSLHQAEKARQDSMSQEDQLIVNICASNRGATTIENIVRGSHDWIKKADVAIALDDMYRYAIMKNRYGNPVKDWIDTHGTRDLEKLMDESHRHEIELRRRAEEQAG